MERVPVESEALRSVGYDRRRRVLEVEFASGAIYRYLGVPSRTHAALMQARSLGGYFGEHIRDAGFMLDRLDEARTGATSPDDAPARDEYTDRHAMPGPDTH